MLDFFPTYNTVMNRLIMNLKRIIVDYYDLNDGNIVIDGFNLKHQIIAEHESVEEMEIKIFIKTYWGGEVEMQILSQVFKVKIKCICETSIKIQ